MLIGTLVGSASGVSPSSRGRGLKYLHGRYCKRARPVALFTRAWIEMSTTNVAERDLLVALFTRAWIEIIASSALSVAACVALFTRAWIEIDNSAVGKR